MARVNPALLKNRKAENAPAIPKRNTEIADSRLSMLSIIKTAVSSSIENVFKRNTLKVELENGKELQMGIQRLETGIGEIARLQRSIQIGKGTIASQKVGSASIANVEQLQLQNIEKLSFAFEQLKPILTALQGSNKLDQQSVSLLKNVISYLIEMNSSIKAQKVDFPVDGIISGLQRVENAVSGMRFEIPEQKDIKFPAFPKNISMLEGKAILKALADVSAKLDGLPKSFPEVTIPKTVSVDNFPPQKYPLPPTNININPLRGFVQSTAITVGTNPVALPTTPLAFRRGIVVYNNDSSNTLYIGGEFVSTSNGIPVPPLSYSPALDAGIKMIVYGISTTNINIRVLETSNDTYTRGD
jgi:hypothetical protein